MLDVLLVIAGGLTLLAVAGTSVTRRFGAAALPLAHPTRDVIDGAAWFAQIGPFVLLGLLGFPDHAVSRMLPRPLRVVAAPLRLRLFGFGQGPLDRSAVSDPPP